MRSLDRPPSYRAQEELPASPGYSDALYVQIYWKHDKNSIQMSFTLRHGRREFDDG